MKTTKGYVDTNTGLKMYDQQDRSRSVGQLNSLDEKKNRRGSR
jgi:hypothetical protein